MRVYLMKSKRKDFCRIDRSYIYCSVSLTYFLSYLINFAFFFILTDWQSCSIDVDCATQCVRAYLDRYGEKCTGSTNITCAQYGGIHNGGPKGCNAEKTSGYRKKVRKVIKFTVTLAFALTLYTSGYISK